MQICETPLAFLSGFIAKIIIIIAIKNDCTLKSPVFCVPRVFHPRHSAIYQVLTAYGAGLMVDSCSLIKTPRMAFALSAIRGRFLPLAFSSALSAWFLLPQIPPISTDALFPCRMALTNSGIDQAG